MLEFFHDNSCQMKDLNHFHKKAPFQIPDMAVTTPLDFTSLPKPLIKHKGCKTANSGTLLGVI